MMKISKKVPVAVAAAFTLTTASVVVALAAPDQGKLQAGAEKIMLANYRDHDHGKGAKDRRGHGGPERGFEMLIKTFDVNGDGKVTQEEIISVRQNRLAEFDANKDGSLDLSEYEALWLDAMHERMVDQFQAHDDNGDGTVTVEEFNEDFANLVERRDRNGDGVLNSDDYKRPPHKGPAGPGGPSGQ